MISIETINGGAGDDIIDLTSPNTSISTAMVIKGEAGSYVIWASAGADMLIGGEGNVVLDKEGLVDIEEINQAISEATGIKAPDFKVTIKSFNEYNSEPSKDGYTDAR